MSLASDRQFKYMYYAWQIFLLFFLIFLYMGNIGCATKNELQSDPDMNLKEIDLYGYEVKCYFLKCLPSSYEWYMK